MKKKTLLMLLALMLSFATHAQLTTTICDGSNVSSSVPIYSNFIASFLSRSQFVYPASMVPIPDSSVISGMTFHLQQPVSSMGNATWNVYLKEVSDSTISAFDNAPATCALVYSGAMNFDSQEMYINFTSTFVYYGGNLMVVFNQTANGDYSDASFKGLWVSGASICSFGYGSLSDYATQENFLPKVTIKYIPSGVDFCFAPQNLAINNITGETALFSWTEQNEASQWEVEYGHAGFVLGTGTTILVNDSSCTLSGLDGNTNYNAYVRSICGVGDTSSSEKISFKTLCGADTEIPFMQDFENVASSYSSYILSALPECWTRICTSTSESPNYNGNPYVHNEANNASNGNNSLRFYVENTADYGDEMAVLPPFANLNTLKLSFKAKCYNYGMLIVGTMNSLTDAITPYDTIYLTTTYQLFDIYLSDVPANNTYLVLQVAKLSDHSINCVYLDELVVDVAPTCIPVADVAISAVDTVSATVSWTEIADATSWEIEYGQTGFVQGTGISVTTTTTSYSLTGLSLGTVYDVYVRSLCSATDMSLWTSTSFKTLTRPATLPYTTDFTDSFDNSQWEMAQVGNCQSNFMISSIDTSACHSAGGALYVTSDGNNNNYVTYANSTLYASRIVYFDDDNYIVSFDWKAAGNGNSDFGRAFLVPIDDFSMQTIGATDVPNAWIALDGAKALSNKTSWTTENAEFTISEAGYYRLVFYWKNGTYGGVNPSLAVDNVNIHILTCPTPVNLVASNPDSVSVQISWTELGTATSWTIEYGAKDFQLGNGTTLTANDTVYTINGLSANTWYDVYLKSVCSSNDNSGTVKTTFHTTCGVSSVFPLVENFDTWPSDALPDCWNKIHRGTVVNFLKYPTIVNNSANAHSGNKYIQFYSNNWGGTADEYLILPAVPDVSALQLSFEAKTITSAQILKLMIGVMTDPTDETTFETIDSISATSTYEEYITYFSDYTGTGKYIAIKCPVPPAGTIANGMVDDIVVDFIPVCVPVSSIVADSISYNGASISWTENGTSTSWLVEYDTAGFVLGTGTSAIVNNTAQYTITGLTEITNYDIYVKSICGVGDTSTASLISIRTSCGINTPIPYINDFENEVSSNYPSSGTPLPECWTRICTSTSTNLSYCNHPYVNGEQHNASNGTKSLRFYSDSNSSYGDEYAVLPGFNDVSSLQISFKAKCYSYGKLVIGTMTSNTDVNTFVPYDSLELTEEFQSYNVYMMNYVGNAHYIALKVEKLASYTVNCVYLDELNIDVIPTCLPIAQADVINIDTASVTLVWKEIGNSNNWKVEYGVFGFEQGMGSVVNVTDTTYTISNLSANTEYDAYITSMCSSTDSSTFVKVSFRTACATYLNMPYAEYFDSYPNGSSTNGRVIPSCWYAIQDINNANYGYYPSVMSGSGGYSGSKYIAFYTNNWGATADEYLILPAINNVSNKQIKFMAKANSAYNTFDFEVGVMTHPDSANTFVTIATYSATTSYEEYITYLSNYNGNGEYLAIKCPLPTGSSTQYGCVDDIEIDFIPDCPPVSTIAYADNDSSSVVLSWVENGDASSWVVEYGVIGFAHGSGTEVTSDTTNLTLTGLTSCTGYNVYVRPICTNTWTGPITFYTAQTPAALPYSCGFETSEVESTKWFIENGTQTNKWYIGQDLYNFGHYSGNQGLYISFDGGLTNYYTNTVSSVYAYRSFELEADTFVVSFRWKNGGGQGTDYMRAFLVPSDVMLTAGQSTGISASTTPQGWINVANELSEKDSWSSFYNENVIVPNAGNYNLVFCWINNGSDAATTGPAIDNVQLFAMECPIPSNLQCTIADMNSATISWTETGSAVSWVLEYGIHGFAQGTGVGTLDTVTEMPYVITDLESHTQYDVYVQANCGNEDGLSGWLGPLSFGTASCTEDMMCPITFRLYDQGFDGWTGANIEIYDASNLLINSVTLNSGTNSIEYNIPFCPELLTFKWNSGLFDVECSFTIINNFGDTLFNSISASGVYDGIIFMTYQHTCTAPNCATPSSLSASAAAPTATDAQVNLTWDATEDAQTYTVLRDGEVIASELTETSYTDVVTADANYCYTVKASCDEDAESVESAESCATVVGIGVEENAAETARVYPNPTNSKITVEANGIIRISVLNVVGQLIYVEELATDEFEFDFAGYEAGVYLLNIQTSTGSSTKRITVIE